MNGKPIRRDAPGMALLMGYLLSFGEVRDTLTPQLLHSFGLHVIDLVAAILGTTRDGAAQAEAGEVRAARLKKVLASIAGRASDPRFTVEVVAAELAVTSRYVQLMLEETGSTFSEHISEHRLRHAWRMLADPGPTNEDRRDCARSRGSATSPISTGPSGAVSARHRPPCECPDAGCCNRLSRPRGDLCLGISLGGGKPPALALILRAKARHRTTEAR